MHHLRSILVVAGLAALAACQDPGTGARATDPGTSDHPGLAAPGPHRTGWILGRDGKPMRITYQVHGGMAVWEGDILLGPADRIASTAEELRRTPGPRLGVVTTYGPFRWQFGVVPYVIDPGVSNPSRITDAMNLVDASTQGVSFVPRTTQPAYIRFVQQFGCASQVGRQGGEQFVYIVDGCTTGAMVHELGHVLGLYHEHTRCDRDYYVAVDTQNIQPGLAYNFDKHCDGAADLYSYDESSIMHYGPYEFSKNGLPTIRSLRGLDYLMGQRTRLSRTDIGTIDWIYPMVTHLAYRVSVPGQGWQGDVTDGRVAGTTGQGLGIDAMAARVTDGTGTGIAYQVSAGFAWSPTASDGQVAASPAQGLPIEAVSIWLVNPQPGQHVCYNAYVTGNGWLGEFCDGAWAGIIGRSTKVEAIEIHLKP